MIGFTLAIVGLFYIVAQCLLAMSFQGYWRLAAFLPIPLLAFLMVTTVGFGHALPFESAGVLLLGLPFALIYLTLLSAAHLASRVVYSERSFDHRHRAGK